jgi:hypothetical protein
MSKPRRGDKSGARTPRGKGKPSRDFWGPEPEQAEARPVGLVRAADHPAALVQSLGPLPLPNGAVAQHYFEVIYERAAALALALAASAELVDLGASD